MEKVGTFASAAKKKCQKKRTSKGHQNSKKRE